MKLKKIFLYAILPLLILYLGGSYYFAGEIIDFKKRTLEEDRNKLQVEGFSHFQLPNPQSLELKNKEGLKLAMWIFPHPSRKNCTVLLLHGYTSTRWGMLKYAPIFWKKGCNIITYDHRKHGESEGVYGTFGYYEKFDLLDVLEYIENELSIQPNQIGILGESMGAAIGIQALSLTNKNYAFLIAESPFLDLDTIVGKKAVDIYGVWVKPFIPMAYAIAEWRANFKVTEVSPKESISKIQIPILLIHSKQDDYTPYTHSVLLYESLDSPKKKLALTDWGAKHAKSIDDDYLKFEKIVLDFIKEYANNFFQ